MQLNMYLIAILTFLTANLHAPWWLCGLGSTSAASITPAPKLTQSARESESDSSSAPQEPIPKVAPSYIKSNSGAVAEGIKLSTIKFFPRLDSKNSGDTRPAAKSRRFAGAIEISLSREDAIAWWCKETETLLRPALNPRASVEEINLQLHQLLEHIPTSNRDGTLAKANEIRLAGVAFSQEIHSPLEICHDTQFADSQDNYKHRWLALREDVRSYRDVIKAIRQQLTDAIAQSPPAESAKLIPSDSYTKIVTWYKALHSAYSNCLTQAEFLGMGKYCKQRGDDMHVPTEIHPLATKAVPYIGGGSCSTPDCPGRWIFSTDFKPICRVCCKNLILPSSATYPLMCRKLTYLSLTFSLVQNLTEQLTSLVSNFCPARKFAWLS